MSRPWDNEPTPLTNRAPGVSRYEPKPVRHYVSIEFARDLERRPRHAERLLEHSTCATCGGIGCGETCCWCDELKSHLAAAKEDGK